MPQEMRSQSGDQQGQQGQQGQGRQTPIHLTALALRGIGQVYDMNMSAARLMLQTQARAASAIGLPDISGLFNTADERTRNVFAASAEQFVYTAQRANEAAAELQREVGRVVESQASTVAETFKQGLEQFGSQTNESLNQLVQTARQQAEEAERVATSLNEQMRESMQQSNEQMKSQMRRGQESLGQAIERGAEQAEQAGQPGGQQPESAEDKDKAGRRRVAA